LSDMVQVNPQRLAALGSGLADLAERVAQHGRALTTVGRPELGGTEPADELVDFASTRVSSTATWLMAAGAALRGLAGATNTAAQIYREVDDESTDRFAVISTAFDTVDDGC